MWQFLGLIFVGVSTFSLADNTLQKRRRNVPSHILMSASYDFNCEGYKRNLAREYPNVPIAQRDCLAALAARVWEQDRELWRLRAELHAKCVQRKIRLIDLNHSKKQTRALIAQLTAPGGAGADVLI